MPEDKSIEVLMREKRVFEPSAEIVEQSNVKKWMNEHGIKDEEELREKARDLEWFWGEMAKEVGIEWYEPYEEVLEWNLPWVKWFKGAKYNIVHDALDKQYEKRPNKIAYIWEGELGEVRKLTYRDLYEKVNKFANALKSLGVGKENKVAIYLPMIPELPIAMLACAKIGAIHTVVFSGFSPDALKERVVDSGAEILITCDGYYRRGSTIDLKENADRGIKDTDVKDVIVYNRLGAEKKEEIPWEKGRDHWWRDVIEGQSTECETEVMDANDILFLLYTSGTTGKPKPIIHAHGGYAVGTSQTLKWVFDIKEDDVFWCAADIGWITGHSYIVYGPLILGATSVMYEGAPDYPEPDRVWDILETHSIDILYTSPTAIRLFMKYGEEWPEKHDLSSLRLLGTVGEPINPKAWLWYYKHIGNEECPIMDTWWQTETGSHVISPLPITPLKPGSATKPLPGFSAEIYDEQGNPVEEEGNYLVLTQPWPAMLQGIYQNPERYKRAYWSKFDDAYLTGDAARKDEDGYFWIQGRLDDVLNVAGHRIGNAEVESALVSHEAVAEAAIAGKPHEVKGTAIVAFVILKRGVEATDELKNELRGHVAEKISPIARPETVYLVEDLPKTRSGKIMRRVLENIVKEQPTGDVSTLRNPEIVESIKKEVQYSVEEE